MPSFDDIVEAEVRESRRPKIEPPPGMVGTSPSSRPTPQPQRRIPLPPEPKSATAGYFSIVGTLTIAAGFLLAPVLLWFGESFLVALAFALSGVFPGMLLLAIASVVDRLTSIAHWSRVVAESLQGTAARND